MLGRFRRVVDLAVGETVLALTTSRVGNGPFHLCLDRLPDAARLPDRFPLHFEGGRWSLGPLVIEVDDPPPLWDARPDWGRLRPRASSLRHLRAVSVREAVHRPSPFASYLLTGDLRKLRALKEAWEQGGEPLAEAVMALAGWGKGLTPSGDDFMAGMMLALWSDHAALTSRAAFLYRVAAPRTTLLSRAFLRAASEGLADARWQRLLQAMAAGAAEAVREAAEEALAFGATSGVDMAAGFLFYWFDLGGDGNAHRSLSPDHSLIHS